MKAQQNPEEALAVKTLYIYLNFSDQLIFSTDFTNSFILDENDKTRLKNIFPGQVSPSNKLTAPEYITNFIISGSVDKNLFDNELIKKFIEKFHLYSEQQKKKINDILVYENFHFTEEKKIPIVFILPFRIFPRSPELIRINDEQILITGYDTPAEIILYSLYYHIIDRQIKEIGIFPNIIILNKTERERYKDIFRIQFSYPEFEANIRYYLINYIMLHFASQKMKEFLEKKFFYIKYSPYNAFYKAWDEISINDSIPFPRLFGAKVLNFLKNSDELPHLDINSIFKGERDLLTVFYMPDNYYSDIKIKKKYDKILKYYKRKINFQAITNREYEDAFINYFHYKKISVYIGNDKNNSFLSNYFNIESANNYFSYSGIIQDQNSSLIITDYSQGLNYLLLSTAHPSLYLNLINHIDNIYYGTYSSKLNFFQKIFLRILYFFL